MPCSTVCSAASGTGMTSRNRHPAGGARASGHDHL